MLLGGLLDSFEDAHVACAAAEVSGEAFLNLLKGGVWILCEEMMSGENHAGRTDATLCPAFFQEALLDGV
jgi:hypothetical protein